MSRIGKAIIRLPEKVEVSWTKGNLVTVKGPKGQLNQQIDPDLSINLEDGVLSLSRPTDQKRHRSVHGLYRALLNNMVIGVSEGYERQMELNGVGYRVTNTNQMLELALGYSHPIHFALPAEVALETLTEKGSPPKIILKSIDKQLIGQVAAKIRAMRKPEPYKGKGIKFVGEIIRRKAGKTSGKK
ncbi:MAG TPA: 50S ribosomal protein L6 [Saprospiraceae bacterium]|nr:50S ribosomal protein L6 [Saprospiraceae bacterium]MCC6689145.1 50S ribosomal protein L6 [Saprospiraceae bacterium]HMV23973.1 50S ribosomal protein L6 [Saprospiraceae bacterium]HMW74279.1 50S ribosomal protein L6 [Saprospiraceae bacterium]HMX82027.1 50S ribosomal protein L6 [Saprospiraceae bacterium]